MTESEKNIAVAKAVGYTIELSGKTWILEHENLEAARIFNECYSLTTDEAWEWIFADEGFSHAPNFCSPDCPHALLALMRETILAQNKVMLLTSYLTTLRFVIANDKISGLEESITMLNATPLQQVEAFLKTMGLWRED